MSDPRMLGDADSHFVAVPIDDGATKVDVHYKVTSDDPDDRPQLLLSHHFYGNVWTWRHVMAALADEARVAALDRPGFGLTQRLARVSWNGSNPYTRAASAALTVGLLDHLGMDRAVLVGSSSGGTSALEVYARHPERVRALVLIGPAITGDVGPPASLRPLLRTRLASRVGARAVRRLGNGITLQRVAGSWHDPSKATQADIDAYSRPLQVEGWNRAFWHLITAERPPNLRGVLRRIEVPTLVVTGANDRVVSPFATRRTAKAVPGARFVSLPACGHTPQEECPDDLVAAIRDFLADLPPA